MGTMLQAQQMEEAIFRGDAIRESPEGSARETSMCSISRSRHIVQAIQRQYLEAGADIIKTNTFNSNAISALDYGLENHVHELNVAGAKIARAVADEFEAAHPGRIPVRRRVDGADQPHGLDVAGCEQPRFARRHLRQIARRVLRAGARPGGRRRGPSAGRNDFRHAERQGRAVCRSTNIFEASGQRVPVMVSVTIADQSGRTLSGQTVEAFWISVSHMDLLSVGINCALGAKQMRPYVEELSHLAPVHISCHPNAGLPNAFGGFDETPERMAADLHDFASNGWLNIAGGCCGTTPAHIKAIAEAVRGLDAARALEAGALHALQRPRAAGASAGLALRQHRRTHQRYRLARNSPS